MMRRIRCRDLEAAGGRIEAGDVALVDVVYFKASGKYYTTDEDVEWPRDPDHYDGWAPFERLHRLWDMSAVCMATPMGFPKFSHAFKIVHRACDGRGCDECEAGYVPNPLRHMHLPAPKVPKVPKGGV